MPNRRTAHRSAIIGAGVAGLAAIKHCLEEGIIPHCFEQLDEIGGVWYYTPERRPKQKAAAFLTLALNTPKETSQFSDYPFSKEQSQFMTHRDFLRYLKGFARHFDLNRYISLNTEVVKVWPTETFEHTGQWFVTIKPREGEETMVFDSVIVCVGQNTDPIYPDIPGRNKFEGEQLHMIDFRVPSIFSNKRVLVIGNGNSAGDGASVAASTGTQTYLSVGKSGTILIPRLPEKGHLDVLFYGNRFTYYMLPLEWTGRHCAATYLAKMDYAAMGMTYSSNPFLGGRFMVTDDMIWRVTCGQVKVVPAVVGYRDNGVMLEGGKYLEVDLILYATGYSIEHDFIEHPAISGRDLHVMNSDPLLLYKSVFPVALAPNITLAFPSAALTRGSSVPLLEMRARWAARVLAGNTPLPSKKHMEAHSWREALYCKAKFGGKYRVFWAEQCDAISNELGVYPSFGKLFLRSPVLAYKVYFGPFLPEHYRLLGPGRCPGAEQRIHEVFDNLYGWDRTRKALTLLTAMVFVLIMIYRLVNGMCGAVTCVGSPLNGTKFSVSHQA